MKDWTIIMYLAGDNNLSDDMISAIREIQGATTLARQPDSPIKYEADISFVIEYDSGHPTSKTRRYVISKGDSISPTTLGVPEIGRIIENDEEENEEESEEENKETPENNDGQIIIEMKEAPKTSVAIKELIKWSARVQPAKYYALIVSGHSDAFQGRTLLVDEDPPGVTSIIELQKAISEGIKSLPNKKLDLIGFEGCVMNTLEVMYQFKKIAHVWIGSQGNIPNYAWDYRGITNQLISAKSEIKKNDLAKIIVSAVKKFHKEYSFGGRSTDISACRLTKLEDLVNDFAFLPLILIISLYAILPKLKEDRDKFDFLDYPIIRALLNSHWKSQTFMHEQAVDIQDFLKILTKSCQTEYNLKEDELLQITVEVCKEISKRIAENKVVIKGATTGVDYHFAKGISIFLPWTVLGYLISRKSYKGVKGDPQKLNFANTFTGQVWIRFLETFLILTQRPPGKLTDLNEKILNIVDEVKTQLLKIFLQNTGTLSLLDSEVEDELLEKLDQVHKSILISLGGTREDQITTRYGIDQRVHYFGRYRNLRVKYLKLQNDFGDE